MKTALVAFLNWSPRRHIALAVVVRLLLVIYAEIHDQLADLPYTDVDYKVFTDAARHVLQAESPFKRHTYRYTPLIAYIAIPNILLHGCCGKLVFSLVDIAVGLLIRRIVLATHRAPSPARAARLASYSMLMWLYNPLGIVIATRGNCDTVASFLVLATLYVLQCKRSFFAAGLIHGLAVHVRLYPIMYSLSYFMYASSYAYSQPGKPSGGRQLVHKSAGAGEKRTIFRMKYVHYLVPNRDQVRLVLGTLTSLCLLTGLFYRLYGYEFLYESYIYHLIRKDTRHNFSLFFYMQYLTAAVKNVGLWQKVLTVLPQVVLLVVLSVKYGLNRHALNFCIAAQSIVMVAYNSVVTSQYFVWILAVLPLSVWDIKMKASSAALYAGVWLMAQAAWLVPAYLLEFQGVNTFLFLWLQSASFFSANIYILGRLIFSFGNELSAKKTT